MLCSFRQGIQSPWPKVSNASLTIENSPDAAHGGLQHALDVVKGGYGKVLDDLK